MQRRNFIKNSFLGLPILFNSSLFGDISKENKKINRRVVVVGAGISGLIASLILKKKGFDVVILEAQNRVGGRLRTNRNLGVAFDEGASWIHGIEKNPITKLALESDMKTFFTDDESILSYDIGGVLRNDSDYATTEEDFYEILQTMMDRGEEGRSFEEVFNSLYPIEANDRLYKFLLSTYVTFDCGDLDKLSSLYYNEGDEFEGVEKISTNGFDTIAKYLARNLKIHLNQRVSKIDYSNDKIAITHNQKVTLADFVLVTAPLGVLKSNKIEFIPKLPFKKQNAINKVGMNCVNKFLLTWDKAFWDDVQYISYTPEQRDKFNYFVNVKKFHPNTNALMTFAYADYGRKTETMKDYEVIDEIMSHLRDIYGDNIPLPTHFLRTKWSTNKNSFGSYSYTSVDTKMEYFDDLAEEIDDKLFFAGEHTNIDYFSTAHGAYLSGVREANKIIKAL